MQEAQCEVRQEWCSGAAAVPASIVSWWPLYHNVSKSLFPAFDHLLCLRMHFNEIKLEKDKLNSKQTLKSGCDQVLTSNFIKRACKIGAMINSI